LANAVPFRRQIAQNSRDRHGLLCHALLRSLAGAQFVGGRAFVFEALDLEAVAFWQRRAGLADSGPEIKRA
jgi:hypothetical protein